ncbi:MFS transporter [Streptomyces sp. TG1A-8]|uniref:MFS transporter n=1 Tax=Streptomyces sp. TG1A-8 TaxID=3051385 RepID=UPI0034647BF5
MTVVAAFLAAMGQFIVNVALTTVHDDLHAPVSRTELSVSGHALVYGAVLITGGRVGALYGYRRLSALGVAAFTLASLGCGPAPSAGVLVTCRLVQGAGAALFSPRRCPFREPFGKRPPRSPRRTPCRPPAPWAPSGPRGPPSQASRCDPPVPDPARPRRARGRPPCRDRLGPHRSRARRAPSRPPDRRAPPGAEDHGESLDQGASRATAQRFPGACRLPALQLQPEEMTSHARLDR